MMMVRFESWNLFGVFLVSEGKYIVENQESESRVFSPCAPVICNDGHIVIVRMDDTSNRHPSEALEQQAGSLSFHLH